MDSQLSVKVAYQGVAGAYSEQALYQHFGENIEAVPHRSFFWGCSAL
jgi:prephenate dehydratase